MARPGRPCASAGVAPEDTVIVIGDGAADVRQAVEGHFGAGAYRFVLQEPQLGTGHAAARRPGGGRAEGAETVVVAYGDTPLLQPEHRAPGAATGTARARRPLTLVTGTCDDPAGYGRIVRAGDEVRARSSRTGTPSDDAARPDREINSGFCAFNAPWLWSRLPGCSRRPTVSCT